MKKSEMPLRIYNPEISMHYTEISDISVGDLKAVFEVVGWAMFLGWSVVEW